LQQPSLAQWNLTLDRQLPFGMALTAAYVGSKGWHAIQTQEGNPTVPVATNASGLPVYGCYLTDQSQYILPDSTGTCNTNATTGCFAAATFASAPCKTTTKANSFSTFGLKTNPAFGPTLYATAGGLTWYHSLQVAVNKRISHGIQFQVNYTWAKSEDNGVKSILDPESTASDQAPNNLSLDKGPAFIDIRQNLRANVIYHAPDFKSDQFYAKPLHGWWFGSIISAQTGYPITPVLGGPGNSDRALQNNINETDRPNIDPSFNASTVVTGDPNHWFQYSMFDLQPAGTLGNAGRGIVRGPQLRNVDVNINKDTRVKWLGEQGNVQFRAELFNVLNHANFLLPSGNVWNGPASGQTTGSAPVGQFGSAGGPIPSMSSGVPSVGRISSTQTKSRQIQLALKIVF